MIAARSANQKFKGLALVVADRDTNYRLITEVLYTAGQAEFEKFKFVAAEGGTSGAVLNAANERANEMFRAGNISFTDIVAITEDVLRQHECIAAPTLAELLAADSWARSEVERSTACRNR